MVLFAPTWRGDSFQDPRVNAGQLLATVKDLQKALDPSEYVVLLKVHQVVYDAVKQRVSGGDGVDFLVPNSVPTNQTLAVADLLVTDYSSIFFDYLATGRPCTTCRTSTTTAAAAASTSTSPTCPDPSAPRYPT